MALEVKTGSFAARTATGNQDVLDVGFKPKAILFFGVAKTSDGYTPHASHSWGLCDGALNIRGVYEYLDDNVTQPSGLSGGGSAYSIAAAGVTDGSFVVSQMLDEGFRLNWTDGCSQAFLVHYVALSGADLQQAAVGDVTVPTKGELAASGLKKTTVGFTPSLVLFQSAFFGVGLAALGLGAALRSDPARQVAIARGDKLPLAVGNSSTATAQKTDRCLYLIGETGTERLAASLYSFDEDGFTLDWSAVESGLPVHYLALAGGDYYLGTESQPSGIASKSTVTGWRPSGAVFFSCGLTADGLSTASGELALGASDGLTDAATWSENVDDVATTEVNQSTISGKAVRFASGPSTTDAEAYVSGRDDNGFTLTWTAADAVERRFFFVAFRAEDTIADSIVVRERPAWHFICCDRSSGVPFGEPAGFSRRVSLGISRTGTASFRIRTNDPLWLAIESGRVALKVYDTMGSVRLYGDVVADEESAVGAGGTVQVTAADVSWRLGHRFVGKDLQGKGLKLTNHAADLMFSVLSHVNSDAPTGIVAGAKDPTVSRTMTWLWKRALDALNELGGIEGSYEWTIRYQDGRPPSCYLDLLQTLGQDRTQQVFLEYGTGLRNCAHYTRRREIEKLANEVWVLGDGAYMVGYAEDAASQAIYDLHQDVLTFGDITVRQVVQALADMHVAVRRKPREIVSVRTVPALSPRYGRDYVIGDRVSCRVLIQGTPRVNGAVRVWGADIDIDDSGQERPTLQLVPD